MFPTKPDIKVPGSYWRSSSSYRLVIRHRVGSHAYVAVHEATPGISYPDLEPPVHHPPRSSSYKVLDSRGPGSGVDATLAEVMNYPVDVEV